MNERRYTLGCVMVAATLAVIGFVPMLRANAQQAGDAEKKVDAWKQLEFFVGSWQGTGDGTSGTSTAERHYEFVLGGRFLHCRTKSVFPPQKKNPKGETHEDWEIFSFDSGRKIPVIRQFNIEGYVNRFALTEISPDGKRMVFTTEHVENGPPGLRARITYTFEGPDEFSENFELDFGSGEFKPCVQSHLKRKSG